MIQQTHCTVKFFLQKLILSSKIWRKKREQNKKQTNKVKKRKEEILGGDGTGQG